MSSRGAQPADTDDGDSGGALFRDQHGVGLDRGIDRKPSSILGTTPATQSRPSGATPITPPTSGGVLDTLKKVDEQQGGRTAPAAPQAPRSR